MKTKLAVLTLLAATAAALAQQAPRPPIDKLVQMRDILNAVSASNGQALIYDNSNPTKPFKFGTQTIGSIQDPVDPTKQLFFDVSGLLGGTPRTLVASNNGGNYVLVTPQTIGTVIAGAGSQPKVVLGINTDGTVAYGGRGSSIQNPLASNTNNYNLSVGQAFYQYWSATGAVNVTGIGLSPTQYDSEEFMIINTGASAITLKNENGSSSQGNRFHNSTGADIVLAQDQKVRVVYDQAMSSGAGRWRVFP